MNKRTGIHKFSNYFSGVLLMGICLCMHFQARAQIDSPPAEQLASLKIAYITKKLSLTTKEAEKFWPVYNKFTDQLDSIKSHSKTLANDLRSNFLSLEEEKLAEIADQFIADKKSEGDLYEEYHRKFKEVLPIRKVLLLYKSEQDFKKEILKLWRQKQLQQRKRRG